MSLPEWVEKHADPFWSCEPCPRGDCLLPKALAVAWEALNYGEKILPLGDPVGRVLRDAMRRIEELGR